MELWDKMWNLWKEHNVPSIGIRNFIIGEDRSNSPWYSILENREHYFSENPIKATAYHLAMYLKDRDVELIAAYKILASVKGYHPNNVLIEPLSFAMGKYNEHTYGWWSANSKYVLPPCHNYSYVEKTNTDKDWEKIVNQAAGEWKNLANEWQIIRIPDYMDTESEEYKSFEKFSNQKYEELEFQKYLRLKEKYENQ